MVLNWKKGLINQFFSIQLSCIFASYKKIIFKSNSISPPISPKIKKPLAMY